MTNFKELPLAAGRMLLAIRFGDDQKEHYPDTLQTGTELQTF